MEWLTSWFEWFGDLLSSIYDFFVSFVDNIIFLFKYIQFAFNMAITFVDNMPSWLSSACFLTISVSVLFMIIGRSTGGAKSD